MYLAQEKQPQFECVRIQKAQLALQILESPSVRKFHYKLGVNLLQRQSNAKLRRAIRRNDFVAQ